MQGFEKLTYHLKMQNIMIAYVLLAMVVSNEFKFMLMTMVLTTSGIMKHGLSHKCRNFKKVE